MDTTEDEKWEWLQQRFNCSDEFMEMAKRIFKVHDKVFRRLAEWPHGHQDQKAEGEAQADSQALTVGSEPEDDFITLDWLAKIGFRTPSKLELTWSNRDFRALLLPDGTHFCFCIRDWTCEIKFGAVGMAPGGNFAWLKTCDSVLHIHSRHELLFILEALISRIGAKQ